MIYAYVRVSTGKQNLENQQLEIEAFCKSNGIAIGRWVQEKTSGTKQPQRRKLNIIMTECAAGDTVICTEISRLGRSLIMVMNVLQFFLENGITVITIKDGYRLGDNIQSKVIAFAFGLSAEIERQLISERTKQGLNRARQEGKRIGREKGKLSSSYKLSPHDSYIREQLLLGRSKMSIAKELHVDIKTLNRHLLRILFNK